MLMKHTYLLIVALPSTSPPTERTWSNNKKFRRQLYKFLCLKLQGHKTESHQISTRCTEITGDYSAKIKIVILQSVFKRQRDKWRSSSNCGQIAAKNARFNSVNSEITELKFTKFGHDVAWLLSLNMLKTDIWLANPLSNAKAKSKCRSTQRRLYNLLCLKPRGHWTESHHISTRCTEVIAD